MNNDVIINQPSINVDKYLLSIVGYSTSTLSPFIFWSCLENQEDASGWNSLNMIKRLAGSNTTDKATSILVKLTESECIPDKIISIDKAYSKNKATKHCRAPSLPSDNL